MATTVQQEQLVSSGPSCCPNLLLEALSDSEAEQAAAIFRALGDPARVKLLSIIASASGGEVCVCNLLSAVSLSQPTISHHLKILLEAGLVSRRKQGTWAYFSIRPESFQAVARALLGTSDSCC